MVLDRGGVAEADGVSEAEVRGCAVDAGGHHLLVSVRITWRDLPGAFGPWQKVWAWRHRLAVAGAWDTIVSALIAQADAEGLVDWSVSGGLHDCSRASARGAHEHNSPPAHPGSP